MYPEHSRILSKLFEAIENKDQALALELIQQINDLNIVETDANGLVNQKASRDKFIERDENGVIQKSALHSAAERDLIDVVKTLYQNQKGVFLEYEDANGKYPIDLALESWSTEVLKFLYEKLHEGADPDDAYDDYDFEEEMINQICSMGDLAMLKWFCIVN